MWELVFRKETNVFRNEDLLGHIELEEGYVPVFYPANIEFFFSASHLRELATQMDEIEKSCDE